MLRNGISIGPNRDIWGVPIGDTDQP